MQAVVMGALKVIYRDAAPPFARTIQLNPPMVKRTRHPIASIMDVVSTGWHS